MLTTLRHGLMGASRTRRIDAPAILGEGQVVLPFVGDGTRDRCRQPVDVSDLRL